MDSKDRVRARVLADRAAMAPEELRLAGTAIARRVLDVWDAVPATGGRGPAAARVASYLAAGSEPATRKLIDALRERGVDVVVPVVLAGGVLDWARYEGPAATAPNRFGIDEPTGARLGAGAVATADM
ncbi:MAG: 5-formyltetrahydrofolate cyclo-ligase, partial [Nocardioidaceae bacterium]